MIGQFRPPYDESVQVPDPTVAQVLVEHNATHAYAVPGEGWATGLLGTPPSAESGLMTWGPR